jgi:hypothetical protein
VQRADPVARRRALTLIVIATVAGALLIGVMPDLPRGIAAWLVTDTAAGPAVHVARLTGAVLLFVTLPVVGIALLVWRIGVRTAASLRFPPPGVRTTRDTPILTGNAARRRGRLLQMLAAVLVATALVMTVLIWAMAERLGAG